MFVLVMAYPPYLRERARELRTEKHLSLDEIAERLVLPKTTVWYWIKDLPLGRRRRASTSQRKGNHAMQNRWRERREAAYAQGLAEYDELVKLPTFRDFVALYIAEGDKRCRNRVAIANSDERVIAMAVGWFLALSDRRLTYSIQYHADQDLDELRRFWGTTLNIDGAVIRMLRKSNSGRLNGRRWRSQHGVLSVRVNDTLFRARLQAWIDRIREDWDLHSATRLGAWRSLVSRTVWGREDPGSNPGAPISNDIGGRFETG
jgi:transcriptional regulator with XRE-family HTH domain